MLHGLVSWVSLVMYDLKRVSCETDYEMTPDGAQILYELQLPRKKTIIQRSTNVYHSNIKALHSVYKTMSTVASTRSKKKASTPRLSRDEMANGCRLGFNSYANTSCAGRHARVELFIEGKTVTANGFASSMAAIENLPIVNVLYAYDSPDGEVFILRVNNSIYLGEGMEDSLLCPSQSPANGIKIDTRPKIYCGNDATTESTSSQVKIPSTVLAARLM